LKAVVKNTNKVALQAIQKELNLEEMIKNGCDVFRLNFSFVKHEDYSETEAILKCIRNAAKKFDKIITILGDLQGPKFRTGEIEGGKLTLKVGQKIKLAYASKESKKMGNSEIIYCPHENLLHVLKKDDRVLIYDGIMEIKVLEKISDTVVETEVLRGGILEPHKGLNLPTARLHFDDREEKDKKKTMRYLFYQTILII